MIRTIILALGLGFVLLLPAGSSAAEKPGHYLEFARYLFDEGDYYRAITEAKRFIFLQPDGREKAEAQLLIAAAHYESGQFPAARDIYLNVIQAQDRPDLTAEALFGFGRCLERIDPRDAAVQFYRQLALKPTVPPEWVDDVRNAARYRLGWLLMEDGRWSEAREAFEAVEAEHPLKVLAARMAEKTRDGEVLPYRSPKTAARLSALVPGAGQLYTGRTKDAALAFFINAAFLWGTFQSYSRGSWVAFTVMGLMEIGWYGGNIYNAMNGAHIYNRTARGNFLLDLRHISQENIPAGRLSNWLSQ